MVDEYVSSLKDKGLFEVLLEQLNHLYMIYNTRWEYSTTSQSYGFFDRWVGQLCEGWGFT